MSTFIVLLTVRKVNDRTRDLGRVLRSITVKDGKRTLCGSATWFAKKSNTMSIILQKNDEFTGKCTHVTEEDREQVRSVIKIDPNVERFSISPIMPSGRSWSQMDIDEEAVIKKFFESAPN